jgi:hypothetical protein
MAVRGRVVTSTDDNGSLPRIRGTVRNVYISVIKITDRINIFSPRKSRPQMKSWASRTQVRCTDVATLLQIRDHISFVQ